MYLILFAYNNLFITKTKSCSLTKVCCIKNSVVIDVSQSVMHVHMHLIPRYKGDVPNPRGGVRGVIPSKKDY